MFSNLANLFRYRGLIQSLVARELKARYRGSALGFVEVQPDRVTILAQIAEKADEIDLGRAESAKKRAEDRLTQLTMDMDAERARISLLKSLIRLQVAARARIRS